MNFSKTFQNFLAKLKKLSVLCFYHKYLRHFWLIKIKWFLIVSNLIVSCANHTVNLSWFKFRFLRAHQVRSYDRNIAVNIWWRHGIHLNFSSCNLPLNTTFENLTFIGFGALADAQIKLIRFVECSLIKLFVLDEFRNSKVFWGSLPQ